MINLFRSLSVVLTALVVVGGLSSIAVSQGMFPGFPDATSLTGDETFPADTNASAGDQTVLISTDLMKDFVNDPSSGQSNSARNIAACAQAAQVSTAGTDATPVITEVYISEIMVPYNVTATGVAVMNGSVASGNIKVGLADSTGAVIATSASTAMSGTDAYQRVPFTATEALTPGTYYVLQFVDNTTARINTLTFGNCGASKQTGQTYATGFTTITPPTTFTTALGPIASLY